MLLDGDFVPGPSTLHAHLRHSVLPALRSEMINRGTLLVVPAFDCQVPWKQESEGLPEFPTSQDGDLLRSMFGAEPSSTAGKNAVVAALETGEVIPFQHEYHSNTDYDRWRTAEEPYEVSGRENVRAWCCRNQHPVITPIPHSMSRT